MGLLGGSWVALVSSWVALGGALGWLLGASQRWMMRYAHVRAIYKKDGLLYCFPRGSKRLQEAPRGSKRLQEAPRGSKRPHEAPRGYF